LPQRKPKRRAVSADAAPDAAGEPYVVDATADALAADAPQAPNKSRPRRKFYRPRPRRPIGEDPVGEPSKTMLFVANLGFNIDDEGLSALFTDADIDVVSARVVRRRWEPRKSKGYGFVDVGSEEQQQKAIEALQGKEVGGRTIAVKIAVSTHRADEADAPAS